MHSTSLAQTAYSTNASAVRTPKGIELEVISKITNRLRAAASRTNHASLAHALHENRLLWTTLAVDVADKDNRLPQSLRAQIFYLAEFTDHQTSRILRGESDTEALVDINLAVIRGLRQSEGGL